MRWRYPTRESPSRASRAIRLDRQTARHDGRHTDDRPPAEGSGHRHLRRRRSLASPAVQGRRGRGLVSTERHPGGRAARPDRRTPRGSRSGSEARRLRGRLRDLRSRRGFRVHRAPARRRRPAARLGGRLSGGLSDRDRRRRLAAPPRRGGRIGRATGADRGRSGAQRQPRPVLPTPSARCAATSRRATPTRSTTR